MLILRHGFPPAFLLGPLALLSSVGMIYVFWLPIVINCSCSCCTSKAVFLPQSQFKEGTSGLRDGDGWVKGVR